MTPWEIAGWIGSILAVSSYAAAIKWNRPILFHTGNVIGSILLAAYEISIGAWPTLILSIAFGTIGVVGVVRSSAEERTQLVDLIVRYAVAIIALTVLVTVGGAIFSLVTQRG